MPPDFGKWYRWLRGTYCFHVHLNFVTPSQMSTLTLWRLLVCLLPGLTLQALHFPTQCTYMFCMILTTDTLFPYITWSVFLRDIHYVLCAIWTKLLFIFKGSSNTANKEQLPDSVYWSTSGVSPELCFGTWCDHVS